MELTKVPGGMDENDNTVRISDTQKELANIKTEFVEIQILSTEKILGATVAVDQNLSSSVTSRISGRIEKLYFKATGETIKKGQPVYEIYSEQLIAAEREYLIALQHEKNSSAIGFDYKQLAEATRQKLLLWGMSNMQISDLENSGEVKNIITIASGEDGIISELMISEGDYVMEGTPVFKLTDLSSVYVEAELYSTEAASLTSDTEAEVTVSSLHDKKVRGKITFATPELLADSKIIILRMEIPNPDQSMKPGMQTYITIRSGSKET